MQLPKEKKLKKLLAKVKNVTEIEVNECITQHIESLSKTEIYTYFRSEQRKEIYNAISLEVSKEALGKSFNGPKFVKEIGLVETVCKNNNKLNVPFYKPRVGKYFHFGAAGSYTDFHTDLGGSAFWFHLHKGEKVFYLIEPTCSNLELYANWQTKKTSYNKNWTFIWNTVPDTVNNRIIHLKEGETAVIPCGWIHAVLTKQDSIAFTGNFVHGGSLDIQQKCQQIEIKTRLPPENRFPNIFLVYWYTAIFFYKCLNIRDGNFCNVLPCSKQRLLLSAEMQKLPVIIEILNDHFKKLFDGKERIDKAEERDNKMIIDGVNNDVKALGFDSPKEFISALGGLTLTDEEETVASTRKKLRKRTLVDTDENKKKKRKVTNHTKKRNTTLKSEMKKKRTFNDTNPNEKKKRKLEEEPKENVVIEEDSDDDGELTPEEIIIWKQLELTPEQRIMWEQLLLSEKAKENANLEITQQQNTLPECNSNKISLDGSNRNIRRKRKHLDEAVKETSTEAYPDSVLSEYSSEFPLVAENSSYHEENEEALNSTVLLEIQKDGKEEIQRKKKKRQKK